MLDITVLAQISAIALLALAVVVFVNSILESGPRKRLMRCPETGAVAFVDANAVSSNTDKAPAVVVHSCEFWPERKDCAQGCLARYDDITPGYRVKLEALRPFEPPSAPG